MPTPTCAVLEPLRPRHPVPHRCRFTAATVRRTGAVPATSSFAASDMVPRRRKTATAPHSTTWPWVRPRLHHPPQLLVSSEPQEDCWKKRRGTQHCQEKEVLLFPYSCKSYVSTHTVFIPRKKLVERFLLHLLHDTKCTRFPPFTISPLLEVSSPPRFQSRFSQTTIKRSSTRLGARST